jgi:hypothetical protein
MKKPPPAEDQITAFLLGEAPSIGPEVERYLADHESARAEAEATRRLAEDLLFAFSMEEELALTPSQRRETLTRHQSPNEEIGESLTILPQPTQPSQVVRPLWKRARFWAATGAASAAASLLTLALVNKAPLPPVNTVSTQPPIPTGMEVTVAQENEKPTWVPTQEDLWEVLIASTPTPPTWPVVGQAPPDHHYPGVAKPNSGVLLPPNPREVLSDWLDRERVAVRSHIRTALHAPLLSGHWTTPGYHARSRE